MSTRKSTSAAAIVGGAAETIGREATLAGAGRALELVVRARVEAGTCAGATLRW
jgi:hypothetical protein